MPKQTEPPAPIRISTNCIWAGKFYNAGEPLPFKRVEDLPENFQPLVVTDLREAEEPNEPCGAFQLNTIYQLTSDGRLGRKLQREVAQMEAEEAREEWIEEQADAPLPPQIAESLQQEHENAVGFAAAQAAAAARAADDASDAAAAAAEPVRLYVKRGSRHYVEIHKTKLRPGEPVYTKDPAGGAYECIGITDSQAQLPDLPIIV